MNSGQMAEVVVRHHLVWADGEGTCACGWSDLTPLFGYHLLGELLDLEDALSDAKPRDEGLQPTIRHEASESFVADPSESEPAVSNAFASEPVAAPSRVVEAPSRVGRGADEPVAVPNDPLIERSIDPQTPDERDERMFTAIRAGAADSYAEVDRVVGLTSSTAYQRFDLLERYGTLPADMVEWRKTRRGKVGNRGKPKANHPWRTSQKAPLVVVSDEETFEERRARMAREASERTWAARHASEAVSEHA